MSRAVLDVPEAAKIDYDSEPALKEGVELLAGEPRAHYLHVAQGELDAVRSRWTQALGNRIELVTRDDAISRGGSARLSASKRGAGSVI